MKNLKSLEGFSKNLSVNNLVDKVFIYGGSASLQYWRTDIGEGKSQTDSKQWDTCF